MSAKSFFADVKAHWSEPDSANGKYVSYKEYAQIFGGVAFNYGAQSALDSKYVGFASACFLIMYHYHLPYLAFSVITLIGLPMSYLWNILGWIINDNLGFLGKTRERRFVTIYSIAMAIGVLVGLVLGGCLGLKMLNGYVRNCDEIIKEIEG